MKPAVRPSAQPGTSEETPCLSAWGISKSFASAGGEILALEGVTADVAQGEFVGIVGPSGCGKSTLCNILAGLEQPDSGEVLMRGRDVTGELGLVAYMPQKDLLLPWKNVLDNTVLGARLAGISRNDARREALSWFPRFGLEGFERAYPAALSGGMRQRAALLRTILSQRQIVLLDEPFGALDAMTRVDMQSWLQDVRGSLSKTMILVTHDIDEAIYLCDRILVMSPRPGHFLAEVSIDLPPDRDHDETVTSDEFMETKRALLRFLGSRRREVRA